MSEYQCYEFVALDRALTTKQMAELRAISTRAVISSTRFWNEYHWGDLKVAPAKLVERYFDAHLYLANWGTHRLMLRVPKARIDAKALKPYFVRGHTAQFTSLGDHVILAFTSDTEDPGYDEQSEGTLAALSPLRTELMCGDLRPAYLAWLLAVQAEDVDEDTAEPPVPAGLSALTAAQEAMVEFLRIDSDLLAAAASGSAAIADDRAPFRRWLAGLSTKDKDAWLKRAADEPDMPLGNELLRAFRKTTKSERASARRTVGELQTIAETRRGVRERTNTAREKKAKATAEAERKRHLTKLSRDVEAAWAKLEKFLELREYDEAVSLAVDLRNLATGDGTTDDFSERFKAMRKRQLRHRRFFSRWKGMRDVAR